MATGTKKTTASRLAKPATNGLPAANPVSGLREKRSADGKKERPHAVVARSLRTDFGLTLPIFSRLVGVPVNDLARWEADGAALSAAATARIARVALILARLARIMRQSFIPTWLEQPNSACKEIGLRTALDLFENREFETIEGMIWHAESGTPG